MPRRILRIDNDAVSVADERRFESEPRLHAAVAAHPEVLPTEDLNLGPLVALGNELNLGAGPMDLLAADPQGRLAIVEFKRGSENPDVREVVAQMLDYGSVLWQLRYDELETAIQRRADDATLSLVDIVEQRCAVLGIPSFDPDVFTSGVSDVLQRGSFVFLYVARDFDVRTRRVMTYLADGTHMTFFAVEVDYFSDPDGTSAVLVPRTAFVPASIAGGESAGSGRSPVPGVTPPASQEVKTLIARMDELAADLGLDVSVVRTGKTYSPGSREPGVRYSMGIGVYATRGAQFNLGVFQERGLDDVAQDIRERLSRISGKPVGPQSWPTAGAGALLRDWDLTRRELMEPYFRARAVAGTD